MRVLCHVCRSELDTSSKGVAQKIAGWAAPRNAGGTNHVRYQVKEPIWAHVACLEEIASPVTANQEKFF